MENKNKNIFGYGFQTSYHDITVNEFYLFGKWYITAKLLIEIKIKGTLSLNPITHGVSDQRLLSDPQAIFS